MRRHSRFLKNAVILTVTSLLLRTVGIFFRIYLSNQIGAEGMGLYQLIVSIYVLGSTFATSGISTAVTRLVADALACGTTDSVHCILRRSVLLSLLLGIASTAILYSGAEAISLYWIKDIRAVSALRVLSFSLPSMGVSSCLRGYFIARRRVAVSSRAQLLEQTVRIGIVCLLLRRFSIFGIGVACTAIMVGDTVAEWASCAFIAAGYAIDRRRLHRELPPRDAQRSVGIVKQILAIAAPITAGRYLNTVLRTVENILVPQSIARYTGSRETGLSQFGALKGMALPLIFFPASFLSAMATLLIPEISSANALHQSERIRNAVEKALRITLLSSILIGGLFTVFSGELGLLLYHSADVGLYLRVLAPLTPIMYTESIVDGILKGLNQQNSSLKYSVADSAIRIVLIVALVPCRGMGAFLFIMVISNVLTSFLNTHRLLKVTGMSVCWDRWIVRPIFGICCATIVALTVTHLPWASLLPGAWLTALGAFCLCGVYVLLIMRLGCLAKSDLRVAQIKNV